MSQRCVRARAVGGWKWLVPRDRLGGERQVTGHRSLVSGHRMRLLLAFVTPGVAALIVASPAVGQAPADSNMARALRVLRSTPVMDGHNDLPWRIREDSTHPMDVEAYDLRKRTPGMTDLARLAAGHVGAQFWSIYTPGEPTDAVYKSKGSVASSPGYARVQLEQFDIAK